MLQIVHKYRKTLFGVLFPLLLALSLSGLGLGAMSKMGRGSNDFAVKINDHEISFAEFNKMNRGKQDPQRLVDQVVAASLLEQRARALGLRSGDDSVLTTLQTEIFRGHFDPAMYEQFLRQIGVSPQEFENNIREEALRSQLTQLLSDLSFASDLEARVKLELEQSKYTAQYVEFDPAAFAGKAETPSEEQINTYYTEHSSDFELPAGVAYDYVLFTPEEYRKSVEVSPDDIELYYADHQSEFTTPERIKARHIRLLYGKDAKPQEMAELKERANQILSRVQAGESFDALALEFSDDAATKSNGGDLGWLTKGKMSKEFDEAAFKLKAPGVAALVEADYGFQIVKVDEYQPQRQKELAEVKDQIIGELQKRDAPIYAANRAQELFEQWKKSNSSLTDFASGHGLKAASTNGILTKDMDPEAGAKGLTAAVLPLAADEKQLADLQDKSALVQVTKAREADIAPLAQVRDKIVERLKAASAKEAAAKEAGRVLSDIRSGKYKSLADAAQAEKLTVAKEADLKRGEPAKGIFADPSINRAVFSTYSAGDKPHDVLTTGGKFYIVQVTDIAKPAAEDLDKKLPLFKQLERGEIANSFVESVVNELKKDAQIEVNPQVLAQG